MKKYLVWILCFVLLFATLGAVPAFAADKAAEETVDAPPLPPHIKEDASVVAIFAAAEVNEIVGPEDAPEDLDPVMTDAILIYYSDNTFDQYAETPKGYELFSTGTYSFKDDGDFDLSDGDEDVIVLEIKQKYSMEEKGLTESEDSEEFVLSTIRVDQIFGPKDKNEVEAIFGDTYCIPYEDEYGVMSKLDAITIYFSDGTFKEYVFLDGDVVFFGSGTYQFDAAGDFHILPFEEDNGTIMLTWNKSLAGFKGKTESFDLGATGLTCLYEKADPDLLPPAAKTEK